MSATLVSAIGGRDQPAGASRWLVTASVLFGSMMGAIDTSVVPRAKA